jgi:LacI family transcriptional regulator
MKRIAVICERDRAYGRGLCLGIAGAAAREKDWSLEFVDDLSVVKSTRLAGFDGVIARISNDDIAAALKLTGLPVVDVYSARIRPEFGSIDGDQPGIGRLAAEFLISRRYRNFAYCGYDGIGYSDARRDSFVATLSESGFPCNVFLTPRDAVNEFGTVITCREIVGLGHDSSTLSAWLKALPAQTAVFCCHDVRAWQVVAVCRAENIPVPRRLAVLGVDNDELICSFAAPKISSIDNSAFQIGKESVRILSRMLASPKVRKNPLHVVVKARGVCERDSTPICPADAEWVADVMEYISRNVEKCVRVDDVAAFAKRSVVAVERGIRNVTGNTIQYHILWTRIETAKKLLLFSQKTIAEVSRLSGFASPQYFSRFFKSRTGITAEEFRSRGG